jgi:hypothetical protein
MDISNPPVPPESGLLTTAPSSAAAGQIQAAEVEKKLKSGRLFLNRLSCCNAKNRSSKRLHVIWEYFNLQTFAPKPHQRHSILLEYEAYLRRRWQVDNPDYVDPLNR